MTDIQTPISEAASRLRALHRRRRRLSPQDRMWYSMLRYYLRNHTKNWRNHRKDALIDMAETSLRETSKTVGEWHEFHDWIAAQGGTIQSAANQRSYQIICAKVDAEVARVQDVIDDYADDDSVLETITESIIAAAAPLGLEYYEPWQDADDGAVWFVNPDTGHKHYFLLGEHHDGWPFEIMSRPILSLEVERGSERWKQAPAINLRGTVLVWSNPNLYHPARWLDSHFGVYNDLGIVERNLPASVDKALSQLNNIRRVKAD